ncbi:MucB/RseB C-terminal domain-containing protein [Psychrobium sp. 1_MG-2023]|uniref:MucB/RseB C-terminal domain-containing protein n=1 Tax=Psychrobium sp. 1_MG-2023 TaxID=3062624 RepID=UPI000C32F3E7|nr:MucB/RseB C-terminal domain-containing protein [Psychrobium sp. 1_MG-2023]MDP2560892.1 MucB/RseB C-terminal domain-containing protein [Psychrobium sp. 1_MG-2023]PKF55967.1 MucB/RseB [Alteromonadales bacterium alter-6D02]
MRYWLLSTLLFVFSANATEKAPLDWLHNMSAAYKQLNFKLPMIHLERNHVQSYAFEHGVIDGEQVVYVASLSGPVSYSYRVADTVTYVEPDIKPYSVKSSHIIGASPAIFVNKIEHIERNYTITKVGKGRVAGRISQLIRLKSKDKHRFNYILWLDMETSLLLRYDLFDLNNNLLEQVQAVGLHITSEPSDNLMKLKHTKLPDFSIATSQQQQTRWGFSWLPSGFDIKAVDNHRLINTSQPVEYLMLSDGLSQISVYVAKRGEISLPEKVFTKSGIVMANQHLGDREVTVVGRIPYETANKIARAVILKP